MWPVAGCSGCGPAAGLLSKQLAWLLLQGEATMEDRIVLAKGDLLPEVMVEGGGGDVTGWRRRWTMVAMLHLAFLLCNLGAGGQRSCRHGTGAGSPAPLPVLAVAPSVWALPAPHCYRLRGTEGLAGTHLICFPKLRTRSTA